MDSRSRTLALPRRCSSFREGRDLNKSRNHAEVKAGVELEEEELEEEEEEEGLSLFVIQSQMRICPTHIRRGGGGDCLYS